MKLIRIILLITLYLVPNAASAGWFRKDASTIVFEGEINTDTYNQFVAISKETFTKVELKSFGGNPNIALKIATSLSEKKVEIIVDDYCFSACANYLALSGKTLILSCNALIGWHGSPSLESYIEVRKRFSNNNAPKELVNLYIKWLQDFKNRETKFFNKQKINPKLISNSVVIPSKHEKKNDNSVNFSLDELTGEYSITRTETATLWLPTKKILEDYGLDTSGFCKPYNENHINFLVKQKGFQFKYSTHAN